MDAATASVVQECSILPSFEELLRENADLKRRLATALEEIERLRRENRQLQRRIDELSRQIEQLRGEGKRQAAPFRKHDEPPTPPKKPGRKPGRRYGRHAHRPPPPRIDETYRVRLPRQCPHCHGERLEKTQVVPQYQTEIPRQAIFRRFDVEVGVCQDCGRSVEGRHELMTSAARGAAGSQLGPNVHALLAIMNKQLGLSHGKCASLLSSAFAGLSISRSTVARSLARTATRCQAAHEQVRREVHDARHVTPDETGWRVAGRNAWLHEFVSPRATCYVIDPTRGGRPAEELLGLDYAGTLVHDGWSVYDRFTSAAHQQCLRHLQRRCEDLLSSVRGMAAKFPRAVLERIDMAYRLRRLWRGHRIDGDEQALAGLALSVELDELARRDYRSVANRRLAGHLRAHAMNWFWFLIDPTIAATNHDAEQGLRGAVVNRKVWGGNRTWTGAQVQATLMSVLRTCRQRLIPAFGFLVRAICSPRPQPLPACTFRELKSSMRPGPLGVWRDQEFCVAAGRRL
jgi:transposase